MHQSTTLEAYGWTPAIASLLDLPHPPRDDVVPGRVARVDRGAALVVTDGAPVHASLSPAVRGVAAGDWVTLRLDDPPRIERVAERTTALVRQDPDGGEQVLAANLDAVAVVCGLDRPVKAGRIERSVLLAWESGAVPVIVLTKADLARDVEAATAEAAAAAPGVDVHAVSAVDGTGLDALSSLLAGGRTVALLGESGAGKSTLTNALAEEEVLVTGGVRRGDAKGRHTTTARHLVPAAGGVVLDAPGIRGVGLVASEEGAARTFPDVEELVQRCRFSDCAHASEPGCAVADAVAGGRLAPDRFERWRRVQRELQHEARKRDPRLQAAQRRAWITVHKAMRDRPVKR